MPVKFSFTSYQLQYKPKQHYKDWSTYITSKDTDRIKKLREKFDRLRCPTRILQVETTFTEIEL